ncbi:NAD(P)/FAD-dependent oxidoreductase [Mesorhizobium sp.]|uniref:flavin-containing monooxygenase n=1 Tax=Mesorhizobium sp. TaxID=1871066 RepID=UPI0025F5BEA5|nr:NAD(P)/FAD-dependent oxidoreductase [Mesorhizobium sp.]
MLEIAPTKQAAAWLESLAQALAAGDVAAASNLFVDDCYWRDLLTFTWNITTMEGREAIADMLAATLATAKPSAWQLTGEAISDDGTIEAWFSFETAVARGEGIMRLRDGRCRTLFTAMTDLKGFEERKGAKRPLGVRHKADPKRETWSEARARETRELGTEEQPYCLVIGGGQGGIMLGARLRQLGVPTIVIEKNARPGDSWRNRYRTLVLHDPVWYDHLPYIPFPENWPVFTPKDKMGDWLEMYTRVMELNYWVATKCLSASYDEAEKVWTVVVDRVGRQITLKPKHIVFATGAYGPPRRIDLPGADRFKGELLHSSQYASGDKFRGRRVAVIGAASSGHDVCVDLWESGAEVTMIQRSPTTVVKSDTLMEVGFEIFSEDALARGITTEKADMIVASTPFALVPKGQRALYEVIKARDAAFYDRLRAAGFALDFGDDETGLLMKAYRTGSGYYIDVGASDLIIDGKIGIRSGVAIKSLTPSGFLFEDGSELAADAIIACTGYQSMNETVASIVSREVADKVGPCWGLGSGVKGDPGPWQGELRNMWKPTAQEALWFHGGNLALSRFYSKYVALQIKARMEGIETPVYGKPSNSGAADLPPRGGNVAEGDRGGRRA